jgi:translocation and assembly module TamB
MSADPPVESAPAAPPPRRGRRWIARGLMGVLVLLVLLAGVIAWIFTTSQGARFVLGRAAGMAGEGVTLEGVEGRIGGLLKIRRIEVSRPDMYARVDDFEMDSAPLAPLSGTLLVNRLAARAVELRTASSEATARVPESFAPPYPVRLEDGRVAELRKGVLTPEAQAEKDPARRREIMNRTRDSDVVVRNLFVKGGGDRGEWRIDEARAETAYGKGTVSGRLGNAAPFDLDVKAAVEGVAADRAYRADVAAQGTLKSFVARLDGMVSGQKASGSAAIEPFATMPLRSVELRAAGVDLSQQAAGPRTRLDVDVRLAAASQGTFAGPVRIDNGDPGPWDRQRLPFSSASARVVVTQERVDVADLAVALAGGGLARGRASLRKSGVEADLALAGVNLAALHGDLQKTRISGRLGASGDRAAQRFVVALRDPRFEIDGRAGLAGERLDVETVRVKTGGGAVTAKGGMALAGRKDFRFEGRAEHFDPSAFVKTSRGDLNFAFVASGSLQGGPSGEAQVEISPSTYAGLATSGRIDVAGDAQRIARADVDVLLGDARLAAKGSFGRAGDAMAVSFRAPNLAAVGKPFGIAMSGHVEGEGRLTGTFKAPAGRLSLKGGDLALPSNVYMRELTLRAEAGTDPASPIDADVQVRGLATGKESPPTVLAESATATLRGTRAAHRLEIQATMTRETSARAVFAGGLDPRARAPSWNGRIETFAFEGRGAFTLQAPATLQAAADRVEVGDARLVGEWGEAHFAVTRWTPRSLEFSGSSPGLRIQNLARSFRVGSVPRSNLVIAGQWNVNAAETFNGSVDFHRVSGDLRLGEPPLPLGLRNLAIKADVVRGRAQASARLDGERVGRLEGTGSALIVRGKTGWELAQDAPVEAKLTAEHTNLEALAPWIGPDAKLGGRLNANVIVSGTGADPRFAGDARAVDLVMREPQSGFEVEQGDVAVRMSGKSVTIERFTAVTPWRAPKPALESFRGMTLPAQGTVSADGSIDLGARTGTLRVKADHAVVTQQPYRFLALSGEARLEARADGLVATGQFKADAGWVGALDTPLPSVSEDVVVVRATKPAAAPAPKGGEKIRIDLRLSLGDHAYFEGRGLDTRLAGDLQLTGTPGSSLRAVGTIRTVGGTYKGYGQDLQIERGLLQFTGPLENPQLNVLAVRKGLAVEPGVEVLGTTTRPRVRLVSTPDVPEPEKLSWLVLGRGPSELAPGDASVLLAAASSMLGGNNPGSDLGKKLGLDEVKIGRADTGSILGVLPQSTVAGKTGSASAAEVVSVGKRITRDVHLSYEQGLADAEGALKVAWQITHNFQVLVRAGYLPGLDAVYRWSFK